MKDLVQFSLVLWLVSSAAAKATHPQEPQRLLHVYNWNQLAQQRELSGGELPSMNGTTVLKVENTNDAPLEISLLKISGPSVIANNIFFSCRLKYENVQGNGRLSLLCWQPHGAPLSGIPGGPTEEIGGMNGKTGDMTGTSDWRTCLFRVDDTIGGLPTRMKMRLILPGRGTVYLQPIKLMGMVPSWWSPKQAGMIGGIGGSLIGCLGALIGLLVAKGRARKFVLGAVRCSIALGVLLTFAGLVAVTLKQPYAVWYALLLPGVILTSVFSFNLHTIRRRYDELEIRRMTSMDATGG